MSELARVEPAPVQDGQQAHVATPAGTQGAAAASGSPASKKRLAVAQQGAASVAQDRMAAPASDPGPPPSWALDEKTLLAGTLAALDAYAYEHPDWITKLPPTPTREKLWQLLVRLRHEDAFAPGLGAFTVSVLLAEDLAAGPLARYARSVGSGTTSVQLSPAATLDRARVLGTALRKLDTVLSGRVQGEVIPNDIIFNLLVDRNLIDAFVEYVRVVAPLLTATDGMEINSFVQFHQETGGQVTKYVGRLTHVRTPHHFKAEVLEQLAANEQDTSRSRPLTLVLHSATDHNGSFHRDPTLGEIVADRRNLVILIEGFATLGDAAATVAQVARKYGQGGKIDQVLIAGHGGARSVELGARRGADGALKHDSIDLDHNAKATDALMQTILRHMDQSSAHRRIVLHACLTNSELLQLPAGTKLEADPVAARNTVKAALARRPSLVSHLAELVASQHGNAEVIGANASTFSGEGHRLIDPKTAALAMSDERDPAIAADKLRYLETGIEPTGVAAALVGLWARSPAAARQAIEARLNPGWRAPSPAAGAPAATPPSKKGAKAWWSNAVADAICALALTHWGEGKVITALPRIAGALGAMCYDKFASITYYDAAVPGPFRSTLFGSLAKHSDWQLPHVRIVGEQLLSAVEPAAGSRLLAVLAASYDAQRASPYLLPHLADRVLGLPGPMAGKLMVAAIDFLNASSAPAKAFLRKLRVKGRFPPELNLAKLLGGFISETALGGAVDSEDFLRPKTEVAAEAPESNVDLDGDGREDVHVSPMALDMAAGRRTPARTAPNDKAPVVVMLERGQAVRVVGAVGYWAAIALPGKTRPGFVWQLGAKSDGQARAQIKEIERMRTGAADKPDGSTPK